MTTIEQFQTLDIKCNLYIFFLPLQAVHRSFLCFCRCQSQKYPALHLNTSVIICFYNEDPNTLFRTVHSVLDQTPSKLLHEILLVDDNSDAGTAAKNIMSGRCFQINLRYLGKIHNEVEDFVGKNFPSKVQLLKTTKREGLIRARIFGAKKATGQVSTALKNPRY